MRLSALSSYVCSSDLFVDQPPRNLTPGHSAVSGDDFADVVEHHQIAVASSVDAKVRAARQQRDDMLFLFVIAGRFKLQLELLLPIQALRTNGRELGRASCRERVCRYV